MTKRTQRIEVGEVPNPDIMQEIAANIEKLFLPDSALARLIDSGIVTATDSELTWREGHLEHVARVYAADPVLAWRDYADDLTVAFAQDARFAALVDAARGE